MQTNFMLISSVIIAYLSVYHRQPSTFQISSTLDAPGAAVVLSVTALLVADLP
jgi:hypothetical protein